MNDYLLNCCLWPGIHHIVDKYWQISKMNISWTATKHFHKKITKRLKFSWNMPPERWTLLMSLLGRYLIITFFSFMSIYGHQHYEATVSQKNKGTNLLHPFNRCCWLSENVQVFFLLLLSQLWFRGRGIFALIFWKFYYRCPTDCKLWGESSNLKSLNFFSKPIRRSNIVTS